MAIDINDSPFHLRTKQIIEEKLKLHADLRALHQRASIFCKGKTLKPFAEAIAAMEQEIEETTEDFGMPIGSLKFAYSPTFPESGKTSEAAKHG